MLHLQQSTIYGNNMLKKIHLMTRKKNDMLIFLYLSTYRSIHILLDFYSIIGLATSLLYNETWTTAFGMP